MDDSLKSQELGEFIFAYAQEHGLQNTQASLSIIREYSVLMPDKADVLYFLVNCQSIARMLIDLGLPFSAKEMDYALSSALLHTVSKHVPTINFRREMVNKHDIDPEICDIVEKITMRGQTSEEELEEFYSRIKADRIALIVRLAERSNLVERLSVVSALKAKVQIADTKRYFFPMCLYAKEHYPELTGPICILMEKMRNLIDVAEILIDQFDSREKELSSNILWLMEENSRLRTMIARLESE